MHTIFARNVNDALPQGIKLIKAIGRPIDPRGMPTLEVPVPVATVYIKPCERVLFYPERDANPFFHFFESLWILAGRRDVAFVEQFNSNIKNYSDDGISFHGAYGYRLRKAFGIEQINEVVRLLQEDARTRQAVLQIWNATYDLGYKTKDMPCNDLIFLKVRNSALQMTVCCRSNDIIWGCYGANAVQFSVLQEYLAARIGCTVGIYTQISDSFHGYIESEAWKKCENIVTSMAYELSYKNIEPYPIVASVQRFDNELQQFMRWCEGDTAVDLPYFNPFFPNVAKPLFVAWQLYKRERNFERAINKLESCQASDWRKAGIEWMQRRQNK